MPLIESISAIRVGVRQFDEEHIRLVEIINQFHDAVKSGEGCSVLENTLHDLSEFASVHFANEEKVLQACSYPGFEEHRRAHQELLRRLGEINASIVTSSTAMQFEVLQFLIDWLTEHTRDVDRKYGKFLNGVGVY